MKHFLERKHLLLQYSQKTWLQGATQWSAIRSQQTTHLLDGTPKVLEIRSTDLRRSCV